MTFSTDSLGHTGIIFLQKNLQRSKFLYHGFIDNINFCNPEILFLIARASIETTSSLAYFLYNLRTFYNGKLKYIDIEHVLNRLDFGSKSPDIRKDASYLTESVNVITMIQTADKLLTEIANDDEESKEKINDFSTVYEILSEYCHPNYFSSIHVGRPMAGIGLIVFHELPKLEKLKGSHLDLVLPAMEFNCSVYFKFYDMTFSLLTKNEITPFLIKGSKTNSI
ncbi:MAG: hypothetical protein AB1488_09585 [Nitrospirota bacterium]